MPLWVSLMRESNPALQLSAVSHRFGGAAVLSSIDLCVSAGEIVCLLGASGCGKTTLLRLIAGLEPLQAGEILFAGETFARPGDEPVPESRRFGLVFQDHVLFPHLSVADNIAFGLTDLSRQQRTERVREQLERMGLAEFGERFPHTLSGGQQQRVALARALAPKPRLMLLDEPFASVDATLRRQLREEARRVLKASGVPSIVVTHDADEALEMGDRIAVMHAGEIVQCETPEGVWRRPANRFVAELFGDTRAISAWREGDKLVTAFGTVPAEPIEGAERCHVLARPESVRIEPTTAPSSVVVSDVRFLGSRYVVQLSAGDETLRSVSVERPSVEVGDRVQVSFDPDQTVAYT